jgi:hypothetical protein
MDPLSLAAMAVPIVAGFLLRVGKRVAGHISQDLEDDATSKLEALYEAIKQRLSGDDFAARSLQRFEEDPENERRQGVLTEVIADAAEADESFAEELDQLVEDAKGVTGILDIGELEGHAAAIKARIVSGNVTGTATAHTVREGAELYGVEADEIRGG